MVKKQNGQKTSIWKNCCFAKKTCIFNALQADLIQAQKNLNLAHLGYHEAKKDASNWRNDFLQELANAIANSKFTTARTELKMLERIKRQQVQAFSIKQMRKKLQDLLCHKVQVSKADETKKLLGKKKIEAAFIKAPIAKFLQANATLPCQPPLSNILKEYQETSAIDAILKGTFHSEAFDNWMSQFFKLLKMPMQAYGK